jgi:hypothetical protein
MLRKLLLAAAAAALLAGPTAMAATARTPRLADGHPDLNGTWDNGAGITFVQGVKSQDGSICVVGCVRPASTAAAPPQAPAPRPPPDRPSYKPEFQAKVAELSKNQVALDPVLRCKNPGLPRIGPPDKIVQTSKELVFLYDDVSGGFFRIVPFARTHRTDIEDSYLGDAIAHWEGDELVVESIRFNEDSWLTDNGAFHTKDMKVTERIRRKGDAAVWQATVDDPAVLTQPWKIRPRPMTRTDVDLVEATPCVDQDLGKLVDNSHHDNPR